MERPHDSWAARDRGVCRTERLLMPVSLTFFTVVGLVLGLSRFIAVLHAALQNSPSSLAAVLFLAAIVGGVAVLIVLASAAIGFLLGILLQLAYGFVAERRLVRPTLWDLWRRNHFFSSIW